VSTEHSPERRHPGRLKGSQAGLLLQRDCPPSAASSASRRKRTWSFSAAAPEVNRRRRVSASKLHRANFGRPCSRRRHPGAPYPSDTPSTANQMRGLYTTVRQLDVPRSIFGERRPGPGEAVGSFRRALCADHSSSGITPYPQPTNTYFNKACLHLLARQSCGQWWSWARQGRRLRLGVALHDWATESRSSSWGSSTGLKATRWIMSTC